jgi:hypothetical protein
MLNAILMNFLSCLRKLFILIVLKLYIFIVQKIKNVMVMKWYSLNMQQEVLIVHA